MTAQETGHNETTLSHTRLEYWEAWNRWHIHQVKYKEELYIDFDLHVKRKFEAPKDIVVSYQNIDNTSCSQSMS